MIATLRRGIGSVLSALVDPTVALSFDRTGYRIHALRFREADLDVDLGGRVALVTGANSGIGLATARGWAARGGRVGLLCRNPQRAEEALALLRDEHGPDAAFVSIVDVSDLASVRRCVDALPGGAVHALVNNAGVLPERRIETGDGLELTFATNVAGPFLLTALLEPRLRAAGGRVVNVSSGGMYTAKVQLDDPQWTRRRSFDGVRAYAETKRAEVILTGLWAERLAPHATAFSMHPGWADTPAVASSLPGFHRVMERVLRTPEEGADTVLWLACREPVPHPSGGFFFDRESRRTHWLPWTRESRAERERLWALCTAAVGLEEGFPAEVAREGA
jgi:NAD(P)-dependent dehydrogenase (short-subunit alcohol dehydrogenase family)